MRDIISKVLLAETEGKKIVESAKADVELILAEARDKARELTSRIRRETQVEIDQLEQESIRTIQQEKQSQLAGFVAVIEAQFPLEQPVRQQAISTGIKCICDFDGGEKKLE